MIDRTVSPAPQSGRGPSGRKAADPDRLELSPLLLRSATGRHHGLSMVRVGADPVGPAPTLELADRSGRRRLRPAAWREEPVADGAVLGVGVWAADRALLRELAAGDLTVRLVADGSACDGAAVTLPDAQRRLFRSFLSGDGGSA